MNAKLGLAAFITSLTAGCAGSPTYDTSVFPPQIVYSGQSAPAPVTAEAKAAK